MTDHPSTFGADDTHQEGIQWDDRASLHRHPDGQGLLDGAKGIRRGTLAEMVSHVAALPPEDQKHYVIQKAGDHQLRHAEIMALASRPDFPKS